MFLLCNIPGKVLLFFLNKQDIMRVNCMQNVTKNYILLRNVAYYAILHLYLQQPGIIKMFLLCNIPGKVLLFFLNKQDIMRVNCMQNVTKNYILLRNVACVLKLSESE